jgi:methyltransferase
VILRLCVCASMAAARLLELRYSRRNMQRSGASDEGSWSRRTYPLMVTLHSGVLAGTLLAGSNRPRRPWLTLLLAAQPVRAWILFLLGNRWNTRGNVPRSLAVETRGPYALVRHPNYVIVAVELAALPLAFDLPRLAAAATLANAGLMVARVRDEERALMAVPAYRAHFARKARFIPYLF